VETGDWRVTIPLGEVALSRPTRNRLAHLTTPASTTPVSVSDRVSDTCYPSHVVVAAVT